MVNDKHFLGRIIVSVPVNTFIFALLLMQHVKVFVLCLFSGKDFLIEKGKLNAVGESDCQI